MSEAANVFLTALGQALSALRLYAPDHPARDRAVERVHEALVSAAAEQGGRGRFTFLDEDVVVGSERLRDLGSWSWGRELASAGLERLEASPGVTRQELETMLVEVVERLDAGSPAPGADAGAIRLPNLRFGRVARSDDPDEWNGDLEGTLDEIGRLFEGARKEGAVEAAIAAAVVEAVGAAVRQSRNLLRLLVPLKDVDQYSTIHSMNVSVLSIGLADQVGYGREDVRAVGKAALLHDVGKTLVPEEILKKPGTLTPDEWTLIKQHPIDGARILFRSRDGLGVAAVVAYEHHMTWDGAGYPSRTFSRPIHPASALVQVCDVYDALRTRRPFRGPWPEERVLAHLRAGAGEAFSPEMVGVFLAMMEALRDGPGAD